MDFMSMFQSKQQGIRGPKFAPPGFTVSLIFTFFFIIIFWKGNSFTYIVTNYLVGANKIFS